MDDYEPNETPDCEIKMRLIVNDNESVYRRQDIWHRLENNKLLMLKWVRFNKNNIKITRCSTLAFASPVGFVWKKGQYHLCIDCKRLNKWICRVQNFITLDLKNGIFSRAY